MVRRRYAIIEAPSVLGLKPTGVDGLAQALLDHGLADRLQARYAGRVEAPPYHDERDPGTGMLNVPAIAGWSPRLASVFAAVLDAGEFPVVLGGDCSILLGSMLALKHRGRFGLLFIDGHADFYQPEANASGEVASMDLALATGYGPAPLATLDARGPLVQLEDVAVIGFRDEVEQRAYGSQPLPADLLALDLAAVRRLGAGRAAATALDRVARPALDGFFIHLDADCVNDRLMPAVDYRLQDGLEWEELAAVLTPALSSGRAVGLEVTIYNPALDDDGTAGRGLADLLAAVLGSAAP